MDQAQIAVKASIMTPKAITIGDCFNPKTARQQKYNSLSGIGTGVGDSAK